MNRGRPLRVVCLHGWRTSGRILEELLSDLRREAGDGFEWHFPDAPHPASGAPLPGIVERWPEGPFAEWWDARTQGDGGVYYDGLEESLRRVREHAEGPFDILLGYSQGAIVATALVAEALTRALPGELPCRGVVLLNSGPPPRDPRLEEVLLHPLELPSIHVGGGRRDFTRHAQSEMITAWSPRGRVELTHSEGHWPPSAEQSRQTLEALVAAMNRWR